MASELSACPGTSQTTQWPISKTASRWSPEWTSPKTSTTRLCTRQLRASTTARSRRIGEQSLPATVNTAKAASLRLCRPTTAAIPTAIPATSIPSRQRTMDRQWLQQRGAIQSFTRSPNCPTSELQQEHTSSPSAWSASFRPPWSFILLLTATVSGSSHRGGS